MQVKKEGKNIKLKAIAEYVSNKLLERFGIQPEYGLEAASTWLPTYPRKDIFESCWSIVSETYAHLIDRSWMLV
jgi:hypothetical protein